MAQPSRHSVQGTLQVPQVKVQILAAVIIVMAFRSKLATKIIIATMASTRIIIKTIAKITAAQAISIVIDIAYFIGLAAGAATAAGPTTIFEFVVL